MSRWLKSWLFFAAMSSGTAALGQDTGALTSGIWEDSTIWTYGTVPNSSANVYIGSTSPGGSAATATVTLAASESAMNVYLGYNNSGGNGTLDLGNNILTIAGNPYIGYSGGAGSLQGGAGGSFTAQNAYVDNANSLNFGINDAVSYLSLANGSVATTAAAGNVTDSVSVDYGSTLNLGADLSVSDNLDVRDGSTVDAHSFGITANAILVGYSGSSSASLIDTGLVQTDYLFLGNGSSLTLHGGDAVNGQIYLTENSVLTVLQTDGMGLTFNGTYAGSLSIDPSQIDLIFSLNGGPNWDFRWLDPSGGGNWIGTLEAMIAVGQITINSPDGYSLVDEGGYTYIMGGFSAVPEPSSLVLLGLGIGGAIIGWTRRRGQANRHQRDVR